VTGSSPGATAPANGLTGAARPAPALTWLEIRGFRAFGAQARRLQLDAPLVVIHASNSQGKTSLAEALEFLISGCSSRRDLLGGAKAEYHNSLRNAHLPDGDDRVYVAAGVRGPDGVVHEVRRELLGDFAAGSDCRSRLLIDGEQRPDLAAVGLPATDPPMSTPVLLQHTLRYVLSTEPKQRVIFFKALLTLTDLDELRARVGLARARLEGAAPGPGLQALAALSRTPLAAFAKQLQQPDAGRSGTPVAAEDVEAVVLKAGGELTGSMSTDLATLADDLATAAAQQRNDAFPLLAFTPARPVPEDPGPLDLSEYGQALAQADRTAATLAPVIEAVLAVPEYRNLTGQPADCPVCATPAALTPARIQALREQTRCSGAANTAAAAALSRTRQLRAVADQLAESLPRTAAGASGWTAARIEDAADAMATLGLPRRLLDEALEAAARTAEAAGNCLRAARRWSDVLRDAEGLLQRRADVPADAGTHTGLTAALGELRAARAASDAAAAALSTQVVPAVDARAATPGLTELRAVVDRARQLPSELQAEAARAARIGRLQAAEKALETATSRVLDRRFEQMSDAISRWWLTVRPEELVGFGGVQRRAGGRLFVNLTAALRSDLHSTPVERDALGVYSDSQLNALGLATFLARAQLLDLPLLVLDDPIPGSDGDHRLTFAQHTLDALLGDGRQVILTTFDHKLADLAATLHAHREHLTYELTLTDPLAGTEPTQTSDAFSRFMLEAEDTINSPTPQGRRAACGSYRSAAERLAKQIIATGRTHAGQPCSVSDVERGAKVLGELVPLVREFALDSAEKGQWTSFGKILNPGNHDDEVPATAALKVVRGNLRAIAKAHGKRWPGGLIR
jgi:hypothetical protein